MVGNKVIGEIGRGFNILLGIFEDDEPGMIPKFAEKIVNLRVFQDENGKMNRSLLDINGEALLVSQFTLCADTRKGRRPSFVKAAPPEKAKPIYEDLKKELENYGVNVQTGEFGGYMDVFIHNDGPTTIVLDSGEI